MDGEAMSYYQQSLKLYKQDGSCNQGVASVYNGQAKILEMQVHGPHIRLLHFTCAVTL